MTGATFLFRQVHPSFVQAGRVTSQVFRPTPKDQSLLSVYDGDQITAEDSWTHFTSQEHCTSAGVLALAQSPKLTQLQVLKIAGNRFRRQSRGAQALKKRFGKKVIW